MSAATACLVSNVHGAALVEISPGDMLKGGLVVDAWLGSDGRVHRYRVRDPELGRSGTAFLVPCPAWDTHSALRKIERLGAARSDSLLRPSDAYILSADALCVVYGGPRGVLVSDLVAEETCLPWTSALGIVDDILAALDAEHEAGVVHGDLGPSRVFAHRDGLARWRGSVIDLGVSLATTDYAAPEVIHHGRAEIQSDLYSAGLIFVHLVTGRRLRFGQTSAMSQAGVIAALRAPGAHARVPLPLAEIITQALTPAPYQRPASASELRARLRGVVHELRPVEERG